MRISTSHRVVLAVLFMASACTIAGIAGARPLAEAPTLTGFAPKGGPIGQKVTIYGHNLDGAAVEFNGVPVANPMVTQNGTHITVNVPPDLSEGAAEIVVTTPGGRVSPTTTFMVGLQAQRPIARPHIWSFTPTQGKAGTRVHIKGSNLGGAMWVKFGGVKAIYTIPKTTEIIARVPKGAHTGKILLKTSTGTATNSMSFKVIGSI